MRWVANDFGTAVSRIDILRAVRPGEPFSTVPHVRPGGESLLHQSGWPKVEKVLQAIDAVAALADRDQVWRLLATLSERQRAAIVLRFFHDMADGEIADALGCRVGTVRSSISRG